MTFCKSKRAAEHVKASMTKFIECKLFLKVNKEKADVSYIRGVKYLGSPFYVRKGKCQLTLQPKSKARMKSALRELTSRSNGWGYCECCQDVSFQVVARGSNLLYGNFLRGFQKFRGRIWGFHRALPVFRRNDVASCRSASASWRKVFADGRVRDGACRRNRGGGSRAAPRRWHSTRGSAVSATCRRTCRSWRAGPCRGHRRCGAGTMWRRG